MTDIGSIKQIEPVVAPYTKCIVLWCTVHICHRNKVKILYIRCTLIHSVLAALFFYNISSSLINSDAQIKCFVYTDVLFACKSNTLSFKLIYDTFNAVTNFMINSFALNHIV